MSERMKAFSWYTVLVCLSSGGYWMKTMRASEVKKLKSFVYNNHRYAFSTESTFTLHGWQPQQSDARWNSFKKVYQMIYRYFVFHGLLVFQEPEDPLHGVVLAIEPLQWKPQTADKWTPSLTKAVNLSPLEERYNKHLNYGSGTISWKVVLVIGIVAVVILLIATGRLNF